MKRSKLISSLSLVAAAIGFNGYAMAGTTDQTVTVGVTLTPECQVVGTPSINVSFNYDAFQTGSATPIETAANRTYSLQCTRSHATPTAAWDTTGGTAAGVGVVGGLQYSLSATVSQNSAGTAASTTSTGTPQTFDVLVGGSIAGGQAGDSSASNSATRTLTLTW